MIVRSYLRHIDEYQYGLQQKTGQRGKPASVACTQPAVAGCRW
jgi:hypothetical protein